MRNPATPELTKFKSMVDKLSPTLSKNKNKNK